MAALIITRHNSARHNSSRPTTARSHLLRARRAFGWILATGALSLGAASRASAQDWVIVSPPDGQELSGDILRVDVHIAKPREGAGCVRVVRMAEGGGRVYDFAMQPGETEIISITQEGARLPEGTYQIELYRDWAKTDLATTSRFSIRQENIPLNLPTLEFPLGGTEFPAGTARIRFSGRATGRVYLGIKKNLRIQGAYPAVPDEFGMWTLDVPWTFGSGQFQVDLFLADPTAIRQVAEDGTVFKVLDGVVQQPGFEWKSYPYPR